MSRIDATSSSKKTSAGGTPFNRDGGKRVARTFAAALLTAFCLLPSAFSVSASDPGTGDWPMWGGTPDRNMVSKAKGMPTSWDVKTKKNVKWVADLGSQTYGN